MDAAGGLATILEAAATEGEPAPAEEEQVLMQASKGVVEMRLMTSGPSEDLDVVEAATTIPDGGVTNEAFVDTENLAYEPREEPCEGKEEPAQPDEDLVQVMDFADASSDDDDDADGAALADALRTMEGFDTAAGLTNEE